MGRKNQSPTARLGEAHPRDTDKLAEPSTKAAELTDEELFGESPRARRAKEPKRQYKALNEQTWADDADVQREVAEAENSPYYWWWMFIRESHDYQMALRGARGEPYASMARDFGVLGNNFSAWWQFTGREIFAEQQAIPEVRELEHGSVVNLNQFHPKLALELPLGISQAQILRQVKKILARRHEGIELRPHAYGTSKRRLFPDSRMRMPTMKILYDVWKVRKNYPKAKWREIGIRLRLSPAHIPRRGDSKEEIKYKRRVMALVVQRYYRKAAALIEFAARGDFPRIR